MAIQYDTGTQKTEIQADMERLAHLAGLVASFSKDLHQQMSICKKKYGAEQMAQELGCSEQDLQDLCDGCQTSVKKVTGEDLQKVTLAEEKVKEM